MTTHLAWDEGIIEEVMREVLGTSIKTKTVKTYCGIRVSSQTIDNKKYTCQKCKRIIEDEQIAFQSIN